MRLRLSVSMVRAAIISSPVVCRTGVQLACQHSGGGEKPRFQHAAAGPASENHAALRRMLLAGFTACCVAATPSLSSAQPTPEKDAPRAPSPAEVPSDGITPGPATPPQPPAAPRTAAPSSPPTLIPRPPFPAETMTAYRAVDSWVRAWSVPREVTAKGIPAVAGAQVVLRLSADVIGRGAIVADSPSLAVMTTAARDALSEAARRLPVENDALADETIKRLAADMTVSLELAGGLIPLGARSYDEAVRELNPGMDGVAARVGDRVVAIFPSTMLLQSMSTRVALSSAAAQAANDPDLGLADMDKLIDDHGARFYRFRVTHLAQGARGAAPLFLSRGARPVGLAEITIDELNAMADRIAEHLLTRAWSGTESFGMSGAYDPCRNTSDPRIAPPVEQLTACLALLGYVEYAGADSARGRELLGLVDRLLFDLTRVEAAETDPRTDIPAAAAWIVATRQRASILIEPPVAPPEEFSAACERIVLTAFTRDRGYDVKLPPAAQPLVAWALVRLAGAEKPGKMRDEAIALAEAAVRRVLRDASPGDLVGRMPWLGWAELDLVRLTGAKDIVSGPALREMRTLTWERQVTASSPAGTDAGSSAGGAGSAGGVGGFDMVGGISFDAGAKGTVVLPTWQTVRPVAFLATMFGEPRLTQPDERTLELARLINAARFLRQLQMDDGTNWMCQNPRRAVGGIRAAAWDQRLPTDASSLTLLAVCELLRALGAKPTK